MVRADPEINRLLEIDAICETFERAWASGRKPQIEDYVQSAREDTINILWQELVLIELQRIMASGQAPSVDEYRRRFPERSHLIRPHWFQAADPGQARLRAGDFVDSFLLKRELGSGGSGTVWLASDEVLQRDVALKFLSTSYASDAKPGSALYEARVAASLDHPRIVAVYGKGVYQHWDYIVSKYVPGEGLHRWASNHRPSFEMIARVFEDIADAVHHAHERQVVHRDLKPANIIVDRDGRPFITDFGIAKRGDWLTIGGMNRQLVGTPGYMSPEQAMGRSCRADRRSDIYSIGAMLYELLTRVKLHQGSPLELIQSTLSKRPSPPRRINPTIPAELESICMRCLRKRPSHRYSNAAKLKADLSAFLEA